MMVANKSHKVPYHGWLDKDNKYQSLVKLGTHPSVNIPCLINTTAHIFLLLHWWNRPNYVWISLATMLGMN
jgi:hypothetical protein